MAILKINKKYLQDKLLEKEQLTPDQAFYVVRDFFSIISENLERGEEVKIYGFGNFKLRDKNARPGRDIHKNKTVQVSARRVVTFTPSRRLIETMSKNKKQLLAAEAKSKPKKRKSQRGFS